jgi:hypothetical protein
MPDKEVAPSASINLILERYEKLVPIRESKSKFEQPLFKGLGLLILLIGLGCAALSWYLSSKYFAYASVFIIYACAGLYFLVGTHSIFLTLKNTDIDVLTNVYDQFDYDIELINKLADDFEEYHLSYAADTFKARSLLIKNRVAIFIGALDKVGILPLGYLAFKTFESIYKSEGVGASFITYFIIGFVALCMYIGVIRVLMTAQWMESIENIFKQAIALKQAKDKDQGSSSLER